MKAILYVVAILAIGGGIFYTTALKSKFEALQAVRLQTIDTEKQKDTEKKAEEKLLADEKATLSNKESAKASLTNQIAGIKATGSSLQRESAGKDDEIASQAKELDVLNATVKEVADILKDLGGDVTLENLPAKIEQVQNDLKAKQNKLDETNTLITAQEKSLTTARSEEDRLHKRLGERASRISKNAMSSVVTAVNNDWGFVVIGAGSNSGFTPQTPLLVERDGRYVGKLKPSAVEPTQTIAEINQESISPGVRVQPGDRVIAQTPVSN